jgi:NAD(P)-dependent dehydrogenase (short-subunit alcohol dehydrogenase family)
MALLEGRVALVTGAGRGIGRATARALGLAGAKVVVNDLGCDKHGRGSDPTIADMAAKELSEDGIAAISSHHDVTVRSQVEEMVALAEDTHGPVDILVNNAGIAIDRNLFDMTDEDWESVTSAHLRAVFYCTQAVVSRLRKKRIGGSVVNMTSIAGLLGNLGQSNEAAQKAGVYGLTRTASIELQRYGITVNAIAPIARTRLTEDLPLFEKVSGTMEPEHVAPAVVYLVSELAEGLSGTVLSVAGGRIATIALVESQGRVKEPDGGLWTPEEIAENYGTIARKA